MSICGARLRNTANALTFRMSGEQTSSSPHPYKLLGVNSWIAQMIRQWIQDCWSVDRKCTGPKSAAANSRNGQLMTSGRSQMLATRNFEDWHTVGAVPWSSVCRRQQWTVTATAYCTRWGIPTNRIVPTGTGINAPQHVYCAWRPRNSVTSHVSQNFTSYIYFLEIKYAEF